MSKEEIENIMIITTVVVGVTGSIALLRIAYLLNKLGKRVDIKRYVFNEMEKIRGVYPDFDPLYELNGEVHFIKVIPAYLNTTEHFEKMCGNIILEMMDKYPNDNICFIDNDVFGNMKNPEPVFTRTDR